MPSEGEVIYLFFYHHEIPFLIKNYRSKRSTAPRIPRYGSSAATASSSSLGPVSSHPIAGITLLLVLSLSIASEPFKQIKPPAYASPPPVFIAWMLSPLDLQPFIVPELDPTRPPAYTAERVDPLEEAETLPLDSQSSIVPELDPTRPPA